MLFQRQFEEYTGEDLSYLIGDEWKEGGCDCPVKCEICGCSDEEE